MAKDLIYTKAYDWILKGILKLKRGIADVFSHETITAKFEEINSLITADHDTAGKRNPAAEQGNDQGATDGPEVLFRGALGTINLTTGKPTTEAESITKMDEQKRDLVANYIARSKEDIQARVKLISVHDRSVA